MALASSAPSPVAAASPASAGGDKRSTPQSVLDVRGALWSQLQYLLTTLSKTNYATHCQEVEKLLGRFGDDAYQLLLTLLMRDIAAATANGTTIPSMSQTPEGLKMKLLSQELQKLPKFPNFISLASGLITAKQVEGRQHFLQDLVKSVSWPLPVQLALGLAFSHSEQPQVQADGQMFLTNKLGEITPNAVKTLPECLVHHLLYYIQTTEIFTEQAKVLMQLESLRQSLLSLHPLNVGPKELSQMKKTRDEEQSKLPANCLDELSLAGVMDELGPGCTATPAAFAAVVEHFPRVTARLVGRAVGLMATTHGATAEATPEQLHCQQAFYDAMHAIGASTAQPTASADKNWNVPNFVQAIKEHVSEGPAFWHSVLRALDYPGLKLTLRGLNLIMSVIRQGTGESELPLVHLLGEWQHKDVQLMILTLCLSAPPDVVNFTTPKRLQWENAPAWASVELVETLLSLATPTLLPKVVQIFDPEPVDGKPVARIGNPLVKHPDLLLLVLLSCKPLHCELRRDLVKRLLKECLSGVASHTRVGTGLLARAAKENINPLCQGLADTFLETPQLAETILNVAVEGKWIEPLMHKCPSARLLSQIILLSGKRGGPENRLGGPQWLRKVLEGEVKVVPSLHTVAQTLLTCIELSPDLPVSDVAAVLAEPVTPGLSPQQKQHAQKISQDRGKTSQASTGEAAFPSEVEEEGNNNFAKIYHHQMDVNLLIRQLEQYKACAPNTREHSVYLCMIHNLFDEFKFFERYPKKELSITAELFGGIVAQNLLTSPRLAHALKFVLQNLHKPAHQNLNDFAVLSLNRFQHRLPEWPQYCTLLQRVPNIEQMVSGISEILAKARQGGDTHQQAAQAQDQIKNLFSQSDHANLQHQIPELAKVLQPEHYQFFSECLVKRASLEPNCHKAYMATLEKMSNKELDTCVVQATYASIKQLLGEHHKIRSSTSDRSLLKNLGSWLGLQTIGRNKPLMARDLDLKGLLFEAIMQGRLIAVVPFVAKVLEHSATSKVFRPPNPWLMGILSLLVDMYQLQDLKLTLKFEVEVLCKNINLPLNELTDTKGVRVQQREKLENIRLELQKSGDLENSSDFNSGKRAPQPPLETSAEENPWEPEKQGIPVHGGITPGMMQPAAIVPTGARQDIQDAYRPDGLQELIVLPPHVNVHYKKHVAMAIDKALKELIQPVVERNAMIACTTTRELVVKDYATEPDDTKLLKAAQQMVKSLAAHLAMVTCKDMLKLHINNQLKLQFKLLDPQTASQLDPATLDSIVMENLEIGVSVVEKAATDEASNQIHQTLAEHLEERQRYHEVWKNSNGVPFELMTDQKMNVDFIKNLPEPLRPKTGLMRTQKSVYEDFAKMMKTRQPEKESEQRRAIERLDQILQEIEEHTTQHYRNLPPGDRRNVLSLTHPSFTTNSQSPQHNHIKKLLCVMPNLIKEDTAVPFARHIFSKVFMYSDRVSHEQKNAGQPQSLYVVLLIEVCLFILQSAREKSGSRIVEELTRLFLAHDKKWHNKDIAVNFIRLHLIDVAEFNKHLTKALTVPDGDQQPRHVVEFAGGIVQKCLVDERLCSQKDLKSTLDALEKIARAAREQGRQQGPAAVQQQPPLTLPQVHQMPAQPLSQQDMLASPSKSAAVPALQASSGPATPTATTPTSANAATMRQIPQQEREEPKGLAPPTVKIPSLVAGRTGGQETREKVFHLLNDWFSICTRKQQPGQEFVAKLQHAGLLKADYMLDKFFALLMEISVEDYCSEVKKLAKDDKGKPRTAGAQHVFQAVDAFSDLIVLLIKCCAWTNSGARKEESEKKEEGKTSVAEVALVNKVLSVVSKVLINNHDFHFNRSDAQQVALAEGQEVQDEFKQQPYFRFFSSLLLALSPPQEPEAGHNTEILVLFAKQLHQLAPTRLPGFAFAWLELLCHRVFMPKLLFKSQEGWPHFERLLLDMLKFLDPWMRSARPTEPVRQLYKGTLKVLLVLLHDFPEFLCNYHFSFCDVIPPICIQMRNVILSSFPRQMKLPDPFTPNLKVDKLPEISESPTILSKYLDALMPENGAAITKDEVDAYLHNHAPEGWLSTVGERLMSKDPKATGCSINTQLLNALVLHVGIEAVTDPENNLATSPTLSLYRELACLDPVGRYHFIGALTNQLRFPNNHTYYFSCVILKLFLDDLPNQEAIQEQITRVLLERLIVNRPHPWGLLVTFIELVKNPIYKFKDKPFIHTSRDIEKLFQSCVNLKN